MTLEQLKRQINLLLDKYERERANGAPIKRAQEHVPTTNLGNIGNREFPRIAVDLYTLLRKRGPLTEAEQCEALGCVHMTVRKYRNQLIKARLVRQGATEHTGRGGRPALRWVAVDA